uniref:uncharacterized protein LOC120346540 n=1 Tax=Styela clava TaxID=7725 RepID=UPI00193A4CA3|nr:uncharacterized protein LOC120346540 [Styela clava]
MHESKVEAYATSKSSAGCFLNIVPVKICANRREIETYAFLDEGSTACLCDERLLDLLKLRGKKTQFSLTTVNAVQTSQDGYAVDFTVKSLDGRESVDLSHVLTVDRLPVKANEAQFDVQSYAHLKGLKIPTLPCKDVMLMIGVNVPKVFWPMDERRGKHNEPSAKKSILGWSLVGPALSYERNSDVHIHCVQVQEKDLLSQQIKCLWESDFKDASLSPIPSMSKEDKYALQLMEDSVEIVDGHYQLPLPWKPGCPDLPDNRSVAMKRLKYIERKLKSDPVLKKKYCDTMEKYISLGFAKRIPNEYKVGRKVQFPTFVANRLAKIEDGSNALQWRYVPTNLNPADDASRGLSVQSLMDERWLKGPSFLQEQEEHWPKPPVQLPELPDEFVRCKIQSQKPQVVANYVSDSALKPMDKFISHFSTWYKLKKASAWMIRFKEPS